MARRVEAVASRALAPRPVPSRRRASRRSITIKQILLAIQELLDSPFPAGARPEGQNLWTSDRAAYDARIREEAAKYRPKNDVIEIE